MKSGYSAALAEKKLPRCQVGKEVFQWRGESSCRFLGGRLTYLKRHVCKSHTNDQWRRITRCVYEPRVSGEGLFRNGISSINLNDRTKVTSKYNLAGAKTLVSSAGTYTEKHNNGWVKFQFNSPANLDGLSVVTGSKDSKKNPDYFHIRIHYIENGK